MAIEVTRVYDLEPGEAGGSGEWRVLVDRLWPRGIRKADLHMDEWCKDVAPSTELRTWYGHEVDRFEEFERRYRAELQQEPAAEAVARIRAQAANHTVVLLTATKDVPHSGARVLLDVLTG